MDMLFLGVFRFCGGVYYLRGSTRPPCKPIASLLARLGLGHQLVRPMGRRAWQGVGLEPRADRGWF